MFKKIFKAGMSFTLAIAMAVIPNSYVFAKALVINSPSQIVLGAASDTYGVQKIDYGEARMIAEKKAEMLTSFYGATSVQYALISNGEIVVSGQSGFYSKENKTPVKDTNMYGIGSISKIFTSAAIMQLVEEGKINLDTPITKYIPEFEMADSRYKDITVRMLLNHSSGLMGSTLVSSILFEDKDFGTYQNLLNYLKYSRLKADPGDFSVYCNDGFTLAELLVERVSGQSFTKFIKENFSNPLGLFNTKTPADSFNFNDVARTYIAGIKHSLPTESFNMIGAGGMYSSAKDLCKFADIFMNYSQSNILEDSSISAMENSEYLTDLWPKQEDATFNYGLGWDSVSLYPFDAYGIQAISKGGDTLLFHGSLIVLPMENMAMAVLSSGGNSSLDEVMAQEVLLSALKCKGTIKEISPKKTFTKPTQTPLESDMKKYEGVYAYYGGLIEVKLSDDGMLSITDPFNPSASSGQLTYGGSGKFYNDTGNIYVSFVEEENKNTYMYCSNYTDYAGLGQTVNTDYQAQKIVDNPVSKEIMDVWKKRNGKNYYPLNEKYSSVMYAYGNPTLQIQLLEDRNYCNNAAIIDENTAKPLIQIPGMNGRDLHDYNFYKMNSIEYLKSGNYLYISEDSIKALSSKSSFQCSIKSDGLARWYKIGKNSANKKIKVTVPKNAAFAVYDENQNYVYYSLVSDKTTVTLPKNGYIVFCGDPSAKFTVKYVK